MNDISLVREYREYLGLTQADLASILDKQSKFSISRQDINRMESGSTTPKSRQLEVEALKFLAQQKKEFDEARNFLQS